MNNDQQTTENFFQVLQQTTWAEPAPVFYRLYYNNETGRPLFYSMEDLPGTYIEITAEQFAASSLKVRVKNGELKPAAPVLPPMLVRSDTHGTPCHPSDVAIVVAEHEPHQKWIPRIHEQD